MFAKKLTTGGLSQPIYQKKFELYNQKMSGMLKLWINYVLDKISFAPYRYHSKIFQSPINNIK